MEQRMAARLAGYAHRPVIKDMLCLVAFAVALFIFFYDPLVRGSCYFQGDIEALMYPIHHFKYEMGKAGKFFLWNPFMFCGQPYFADIGSGMFYPVNALFFFITTERAFVYFVIIHFFLGGFFSFIYLRGKGLGRWSSAAGALFYAFSGYMVIRVMHSSFLSACALLPLMFHMADNLIRKPAAFSASLLGLSLALPLLSGNHQISVAVYLYIILYFAGQLSIAKPDNRERLKIMALFLGAVIFSLLIMAVQMAPALEYLSQLPRAQYGVTFQEATLGSFGAEELIMSVIPDFYGLPWSQPRYSGEVSYCEVSFYIGIFPLLLCGASLLSGENRKNILLWIMLCVMTLLLAMGKHTPLYALLHIHIPVFGLFRNPVRFLCFALPGISYFIGCAVERLGKIKSGPGAMRDRGVRLFFCLSLTLLLSSIFFSLISPALSSRGLYYFWLTGFGGLAAIYLRMSGYLDKVSFNVIAFLILLISSFSFGYRLNPTTDPLYFARNRNFFSSISGRIPPERMYYFPFYNGERNYPMTLGISCVMNYNPQVLRLYAEYLLYAEKEQYFTPQAAHELMRNSNIMPLKNLDNKMIRLLSITTVIHGQRPALPPYAMEQGRTTYPRAFIPGAWKNMGDDRKTLSLMKAASFDPLKLLLIHGDTSGGSAAETLMENVDGKSEEVCFLSFEPDRIRLKVHPERNCWLFLSEIYYPGWKARVDGEERPVRRANYLFRAIPLKAGDKTVELYFMPDSLIRGAVISIGALVLLMVLCAGQIKVSLRSPVNIQ